MSALTNWMSVHTMPLIYDVSKGLMALPQGHSPLPLSILCKVYRRYVAKRGCRMAQAVSNRDRFWHTTVLPVGRYTTVLPVGRHTTVLPVGRYTSVLPVGLLRKHLIYLFLFGEVELSRALFELAREYHGRVQVRSRSLQCGSIALATLCLTNAAA